MLSTVLVILIHMFSSPIPALFCHSLLLENIASAHEKSPFLENFEVLLSQKALHCVAKRAQTLRSTKKMLY